MSNKTVQSEVMEHETVALVKCQSCEGKWEHCITVNEPTTELINMFHSESVLCPKCNHYNRPLIVVTEL